MVRTVVALLLDCTEQSGVMVIKKKLNKKKEWKKEREKKVEIATEKFTKQHLAVNCASVSVR